jgi:hypothetical protein
MPFLSLVLWVLLQLPVGWAGVPVALPAGIAAPVAAFSPGQDFPVPRNIPNLLFYLQRDPDANTVIYQLNLTEQGELNEAEPIKVF